MSHMDSNVLDEVKLDDYIVTVRCGKHLVAIICFMSKEPLNPEKKLHRGLQFIFRNNPEFIDIIKKKSIDYEAIIDLLVCHPNYKGRESARSL